MKLQAASEQEQERLGTRLAESVGERALVFLHGDLGAGKTTLVRGFLRGLGHQGKVKSPTYTLMETYEVGGKSVCHMDLYRLADPGELEYLGLRDLLAEQGVILVEWPERGQGEFPPPDLIVDISYRPDGRDLDLRAETSAGEDWLQRLEKCA